MARVTSKKTRQFICAPAVELAEGVTADTIELFNADGTPYEPIDGGGMNWGGQWNEDTPYVAGSVVRDLETYFADSPGKQHLYMAMLTVAAGQPSPAVDAAMLPPGSSVEGDATPRLTAAPLVDGEAILKGAEVAQVFFFDLSTGGTITLTDIVDSDVSDIYVYDSTGETVGDGYSSPDSTYEVTGLATGRYYIWMVRSDVMPNVAQFTVVPSAGAVLVDSVVNWELLL